MHIEKARLTLIASQLPPWRLPSASWADDRFTRLVIEAREVPAGIAFVSRFV